MMLFGKSNPHMEIVAADFLPQDKQLSILAADSDKNIHVLQYDPESMTAPNKSDIVHWADQFRRRQITHWTTSCTPQYISQRPLPDKHASVA